MAISKERLKELIEQEATVWFVSNKNVTPFWLLKDNNYVFESLEKIDLYENKEDAEFVAKYHTKRPEYFEPPTWEEFKLREPYNYFIFTSKDVQYGLGIGAYYREIIINNNGSVLFQEKFTKENYYKAVEQARKLFLGCNDEN